MAALTQYQSAIHQTYTRSQAHHETKPKTCCSLNPRKNLQRWIFCITTEYRIQKRIKSKASNPSQTLLCFLSKGIGLQVSKRETSLDGFNGGDVLKKLEVEHLKTGGWLSTTVPLKSQRHFFTTALKTCN